MASASFAKYTKTTRRAQFLAEMDRVVPWRELGARVDPVYPKPGNGRPPIGVERMLRIYFLQHGFNLSHPAVEEALWDSPTMRAFVGSISGRSPCRTRPSSARSAIGSRRTGNRWKSHIWARVEHAIGVIERVFGFTKVCYRGLAKSRHRLVVACALANIFMMRKRLLRLEGA